MSGSQRAKGARGEREVVDALNALGMMAERTAQYCGKTGLAPDVQLQGTTAHIEVKRTERLKWRQTLIQVNRDARGRRWFILHRQNGMPWLVIQTLDQWASDSECARQAKAHRKAVIEAAAQDIQA